MADTILGVVRIASQVDGSVTLPGPVLGVPADALTIPMVGFPPDCKLRKGERVTLVKEPSGLFAARPYVRSTVITNRIGTQNQSFLVFSTDEPGPPNVLHVRPIQNDKQ